MKENLIQTESKAFAVRIVRLYQFLCDQRKEYILSKQLLRSGTSIGANVTESLCGISKKDFLAKMHIAFKECAESQYWLDLLHETNYLSTEEFNSISTDCEELQKLLSSITKTASQSLNS